MNMTKKRFNDSVPQRVLCCLHYVLLFLGLHIISGCSFLLDPQVCESDADCNGGVCQVGVCIGDEKEAGESVVEMDMLAGEEGGIEADIGMANTEAGDEVIVDMLLAGEMTAGDEAGESVIEMDMMVTEEFECQIITSSLSRAGAILRDIPSGIDGTTHWVTNEESLTVEVALVTPNQTLWAENTRLYLGETELTLEEDNETWRSTFMLTEEGEYRLRLLIGSANDIRCVDQVVLTVDRSVPDLTLVNPNSQESWIGQLGDMNQTNLSIEVRDLTRTQLTILNDNNTELATRDYDEAVQWSSNVLLREGENRFTIKAQDELMQESNKELIMHYDPHPPGIGLGQPNSTRVTVENHQITISGFIYQRTGLGGIGGEGGIEADARLVVTTYQGIDETGEESNRALTRSNEEGAFSLTTPLTVGANFVQICAYDRADNQTCTSLSVTRVESQPCINLTSAEYTSTATYQITGNVCPSVTVLSLVTDEAEMPQDVVINPDFTFTREITIPQANQALSYTITATAADGQSVNVSASVLWDNTPPIVVISTPTASSCFNDEVIELCGRVVDPESGTNAVRLNQTPLDLSGQFLEGEQWWEGFCAPVELSIPQGLSHREQTLTLTGINGTGISNTASVTITVDRSGPSLLFDPPTFEQWYAPNNFGFIEMTGSIVNQGCALASPSPIVITVNEEDRGTLILEGNSRFSYRSALADGPYLLQATLRDRAGNESSQDYHFSVDSLGPQIDLITPNQRTISKSSTLQVTVEANDLGSGVQHTSGIVQIGEQEFPLSATVVENRVEFTTQLTLDPGEHPMTLRISDQVGNHSTVELTYIRDITAPTVSVVSPTLTDPLSHLEQFILEVNDDYSQVTSVTVNNVAAVPLGGLWLAGNVPIDLNDPQIEIEAQDEADNLLSEGEQQSSFAVSLHSLVWQEPGQLGLPHRGYQLSDLSFSEDTSVGLGPVNTLLWFSDFTSRADLVTLFTPMLDIPPSIFSGVDDNGGVSFDMSSTQPLASPQGLLPSGEQLVDIQRASIEGVLTLFTLSDDEGSVPTLQLWQRYADIRDGTTIISAEDNDLETWVEVRLQLPPTLHANAMAIGDVTGDGRFDLITASPTGVLLFRQTNDGNFAFEGNEGLVQRGLGSINTTAQNLWWIDLNGDGLRDLVEQTSSSLNAWLNELNNNVYAFTQVTNFPSISVNHQIDGWLQIDWDLDGELDPIAWSKGSAQEMAVIKRYLLNNGTWTTETIINDSEMPSPLVKVLSADLDADRQPELLCVGTQQIKAYEVDQGLIDVTMPPLPQIENELVEIDQVELVDFDQDGDEDWAFAFNTLGPATAEDANQLRGELWVLNHSPKVVNNQTNPIRLLLKRRNAEAQDSQNIYILIDTNNDLNFEEIHLARAFSETIIHTQGEGTINIQVQFPDYGQLGDHTLTEYDIAHGSSLTLVDPQE